MRNKRATILTKLSKTRKKNLDLDLLLAEANEQVVHLALLLQDLLPTSCKVNAVAVVAAVATAASPRVSLLQLCLEGRIQLGEVGKFGLSPGSTSRARFGCSLRSLCARVGGS